MAAQPNILWIVTTQWRASATGYAGDGNARTPWLDGLASEAVNYTQAVTPHPFGPQARAALLTGKLCPENGVSDYWDPLPIYDEQQNPSGGRGPALGRTVAHALRDRGYATAFFGKWHLAPRDRQAPLVGEVHAKMLVPPARRGGFELWEGFESGFLLNDPWLHGTRLPAPKHFKGYQADVLMQRAAEWLAQASTHSPGKPTFCVVSLEAPHPPYHAPAPHVAEVRPAAIALRPNVPRGGDVERQARAELAGYYAHIEATDRAIGQLLAEVDLKETAVVFTSVHGDMHGSHGLFRKAWPYEESIRVPLLIRREQGARGRRQTGRITVRSVSWICRIWRWPGPRGGTGIANGTARTSPCRPRRRSPRSVRTHGAASARLSTNWCSTRMVRPGSTSIWSAIPWK